MKCGKQLHFSLKFLGVKCLLYLMFGSLTFWTVFQWQQSNEDYKQCKLMIFLIKVSDEALILIVPLVVGLD